MKRRMFHEAYIVDGRYHNISSSCFTAGYDAKPGVPKKEPVKNKSIGITADAFLIRWQYTRPFRESHAAAVLQM